MKSKSISKSMIFNMAIRNIRRNKRRSVLSAVAIFIVLVLACFMAAIIKSQNEILVTNLINQVSGNIRLRNQLYSDNERIQPLQFFVPQTDELLSFIKSQKGVAGAEPHISIGTIVDPNGDSTVTSLIGVNFETSRLFSDRHTEIISGKIPSSGDKNAAVISPFMANHFNLKVGDKFTAYWAKTAVGTNAATLTVSGIATFGNTDFLGLNFFMDWKQLSDKLRMNGNALEILVHTEDELPREETENLILAIQNFDNSLEAKEWTEVSYIAQQFEQGKTITMFMSFFLVLMAATVILNSTMMAALERKKEIGMLMSLGMDAKHIKNLLLLESALLAFIASFWGVLIGFIIVSILETTGINVLSMLGEIEGGGASFPSWIYPNLDFSSYIFFLLLGTFVSTIACIIPARMALRIQPSEALRSEE